MAFQFGKGVVLKIWNLKTPCYQEVIEGISIPVDVANGIGSNMAQLRRDSIQTLETRITMVTRIDLATCRHA